MYAFKLSGFLLPVFAWLSISHSTSNEAAKKQVSAAPVAEKTKGRPKFCSAKSATQIFLHSRCAHPCISAVADVPVTSKAASKNRQ